MLRDDLESAPTVVSLAEAFWVIVTNGRVSVQSAITCTTIGFPSLSTSKVMGSPISSFRRRAVIPDRPVTS
jgi:hypothetical protein